MLVFFSFFVCREEEREGLPPSFCAKGSADARVAQVAAKRVAKCIVAECVLCVGV